MSTLFFLFFNYISYYSVIHFYLDKMFSYSSYKVNAHPKPFTVTINTPSTWNTVPPDSRPYLGSLSSNTTFLERFFQNLPKIMHPSICLLVICLFYLYSYSLLLPAIATCTHIHTYFCFLIFLYFSHKNVSVSRIGSLFRSLFLQCLLQSLAENSHPDK